jgi:hypothetical protein
MKISELIGSLQQCDQNLDVTVEIKFVRDLGVDELRALTAKERKRVPLRQGKPVAFEPLALPPPGPVSALAETVAAEEASLNDRMARALMAPAEMHR